MRGGGVAPSRFRRDIYICIRRKCPVGGTRKSEQIRGVTCVAKVTPIPLTLGGVATRIRGSIFPGGVPKRPTGADCKSAGLRLRRFESFPLHQLRGRKGLSADGRHWRV